MSYWRHFRAIAILPFTVLLVIPGSILLIWDSSKPFWHLEGIPLLAVLIFSLVTVSLGLAVMYKTIELFADEGAGTLAPWDATERLVTVGLYAHVRNPMMVGVFLVQVGEVTIFGSPYIALWVALFILANVVYIPLFEEPGLERRFGEEYVVYKENVPRWIPRREPWSYGA